MNEVTVSAVLVVPPIRGRPATHQGTCPCHAAPAVPPAGGNEYGQPHEEAPSRADSSDQATERILREGHKGRLICAPSAIRTRDLLLRSNPAADAVANCGGAGQVRGDRR